MLKTLKKTVAIIVTLAFAISLMPNMALAEATVPTTVTVNFINGAVTRSSSGTMNANETQNYHWTLGDYYGSPLLTTGNSYRGFAQMDFTGYEAILNNANTTIGFNIVAGGYSNSWARDVRAIIQPGSVDDSYDADTMTYAIANGLGMLNTTDKLVLFTESDGADTANGGSSSGTADKVALLSALNADSDDSVITLYFESLGSGDNQLRLSSATGIQINYVESEIDNQAYVTSLANGLTWDKISADSSDAVVNNITLPAKYLGADVTWTSSNPDAVNAETGVVTPVKGSAQTSTLTATLTYNGIIGEEATATATFDVIVPAKAMSKVVVPSSVLMYKHNTRGGSHENTIQSVESSFVIQNNTGYRTNDRQAYFRLDLSGYEEYINIARNVNVTFAGGSGQSTTGTAEIALLSAKNDTIWNVSNLNYKLTSDTGMLTELGYCSHIFNMGRNVNFSFNGLAAGLKQELIDDPTNSTITFRLNGAPNDTTEMYIHNPSITMEIEYYEDEINEDEYAEDVFEEFEWNKFSVEDTNAVTVATKLPLKYKGLDVAWTSTNSDVVNVTTGVITPAKEDKTVKLTAALSYKGKTVGTETIEIIVAKEEMVVKSVNQSTNTYIDDLDPDYAYGAASNRYRWSMMETKGMYKTHNEREDRHAFMKWGLSDYVKEIEAAQSISIRFVTDEAQTHAKGFNITVMSKDMADWTTALTYDSAVASGIYTDPGIYTEYGANIVSTATDNYVHAPITSEGLTNAIKAAVANDPENAVLSLRYSSSDIELVQYQLDACYLDIEYYESDLKSVDEYTASALSVMPWSAVSAQDINNVVADLTLPATINGEAIVWTSDDDSVIAFDGTVTIGSNAKTVNLTATVGSNSKVFTVTVPANSIAVKSNVMSNTGGQLYDYSNAYIFANSDVAAVDVAVATYVNGELLNVTVRENVTLKKGLNIFYSDLHRGVGVTTKAIVVDDIASTIKPLAVAK